VLFIPTANMLTELRAARADNSYARRLLRFTTPDLLLLDDLGLRPLRHEEPEDLYEVIRQRHQRGSTIITSNRDIEEWPPLFGEPLLASAALDRLLQDAHVVEMPGDSFRTSARAKRGRGGPAASGSDT
jgi:DNA replication protein DnaC